MALVRLCWLVAAAAGELLAGSPADDEFKAALLVSFTRFTEWPAGEGSLQVCVAARPDFVALAERAATGKTAGGRSLTVRAMRSPADTRDCRVLYVAGYAAAQYLPALRNSNILTIGDDSHFLSRGGHIGLFQEEGRFSFEADVDAIKRIGLTVSSKLLRLGYVRHGATKEGRVP